MSLRCFLIRVYMREMELSCTFRTCGKLYDTYQSLAAMMEVAYIIVEAHMNRIHSWHPAILL